MAADAKTVGRNRQVLLLGALGLGFVFACYLSFVRSDQDSYDPALDLPASSFLDEGTGEANLVELDADTLFTGSDRNPFVGMSTEVDDVVDEVDPGATDLVADLDPAG